MVHVFVLIISTIMFFVSSNNIPIETCLLIIVPYVWYLSKNLKNYRGRILVPPYLLTLYLLFSIVVGALFIKYDFSPMILLQYGGYGDKELARCIYISLIGVSSCWLSFSLLLKWKNPFVQKIEFSIEPMVLKKGTKLVSVLLLVVLLYLVATGNFGYFAEDSNMSNYTEKIYQFLLLIVTFYFLYDNGRLTHNNKFYSFIIIAISSLGLLSGSKTLLILPLFTLYVVESIKTNKWTNKYLKMIPILFVTAFLLIIPIRYMLRLNTSISSQESMDLIISSADGRSIGYMLISDISDRLNYVPVLNVAINHSGYSPENVTHLWEYTLMSPIYAFVPRFIYPDKPSNTFANWYAYNLMGSTENNNMSATYQGILYMNGGVVSVVLGFLLVGVLFYLVYIYYFQDRYIYIFLTQIMTFVVLPSEPWALFVATIQNFVLYYLLHKIIAQK